MVDVEMAAVLPAQNGFLSVLCSILRKFRLVYHNEISLPYFVYGRTFESEIPFLNGIVAECSVNLHPEPVQQTSSSDLPLIVFCVNSTRVGTDAAAALRNGEEMYGNRMVIMVVMNHVPRQAAYKKPFSHVHVQQNNVLATHDCFFSENEGLHACNENREAIIEVARLISRKLQPPQYRLNKPVFASYIGFGVSLYLCRRIFFPVSGRR